MLMHGLAAYHVLTISDVWRPQLYVAVGSFDMFYSSHLNLGGHTRH